MVEYAMLLSLIALALVGTIGGMAGQVGGRFNAISNTLSNNGIGAFAPNPETQTPPPTTPPAPNPDPGTTEKPEPLEGEAYAVYSDDDASLEFFRGDSMPSVGSKSKSGKTVTFVFSDIEDGAQDYYGNAYWYNKLRMKVKYVKFRDVVRPKSVHGWFANLSKLIAVDLHKLDTSECTDMRMMFFGSSGLTNGVAYSDYDTNLDLNGFDTSKVKSMEKMFEGCPGLRSIDISGWDTSSVTDMSRMFGGDIGITSVGDLVGWDVSKVTNFSGMFESCSALEGLDGIGKWETASAENMDTMFAGANKVKADLSKWSVGKVSNHRDFYTGPSSSAFKSPKWK